MLNPPLKKNNPLRKEDIRMKETEDVSLSADVLLTQRSMDEDDWAAFNPDFNAVLVDRAERASRRDRKKGSLEEGESKRYEGSKCVFQ